MIKIQHSKTDEWRQGDEVLVARTNWNMSSSPVECYMRLTGMSWQDERFLFRPI